METTAQRHIRVYESLKGARASLESYWQDLAYLALPRKAYITRIKSSGDRLPTDIYDSTAIMALSYFAAGMQAYMSSPQTKWFTIGLKNRFLMKQKAAAVYLKDVEDALYACINNSNFYQEDVEGYLNLGSVGSDVLYCEEDLKEDVRFDSIPIENVIINVDDAGRAVGAYLEYEFNAEQAIIKFGKDAGEKVRDAYEKAKFDVKFRYLFCVVKRDVYDQSKKDAKNMPYASLWIDRDQKVTVKEKGYREFPFFFSRFAKGKGDPYGYSPEMNVYADIKMINAMEQTNILGAQTAVKPPLEIPDEAFLRPLNFNPGGQNIKNAGFPNEHITPIVTGANVMLGIEYIERKERKIQQAFYNDLFLQIEQIGKMTAFEVSIRNNQRMQMLGSAIGNIMREKLSPVIDRTYAILGRLGKLPPLPPELINQEYVIEYISPLARAQKSIELNNLQQALGIIATFAQANPEALDKIDFDEAINYVADITSITPKIIRDDGEVADIRQNRGEQQAMAQQLAALQQGAATVETATKADKNIADAKKQAVVA